MMLRCETCGQWVLPNDFHHEFAEIAYPQFPQFLVPTIVKCNVGCEQLFRNQWYGGWDVGTAHDATVWWGMQRHAYADLKKLYDESHKTVPWSWFVPLSNYEKAHSEPTISADKAKELEDWFEK